MVVVVEVVGLLLLLTADSNRLIIQPSTVD